MIQNPSWRDRTIQFLDEPKSLAGVLFSLFIFLLIYVSVALLVFEVRQPRFAAEHRALLSTANYVILTIFGLEYCARLIVYRQRAKYAVSLYGIIDLLAILPGVLTIFLPFTFNLAWLRVLRIFRVLRFLLLVKLVRVRGGVGEVLGGMVQRLIPWVAFAAGIKGVVLAAEAWEYWPEIAGLSVVITVVGFAISILLGAKLSIVQGRFYDVEDAICRILGAVTDMKKTDETAPALSRWVESLKESIEEDSAERYRALKHETKELEDVLESNGVGGPVTAGFHKDVEFLIHRLRTRTPSFLEQFLRYVTLVYAGAAILAIPGFIGFFSVLLIVFVLGGMYLLIDDLDVPLAKEGRSMFSIDLTPIEEYKCARHT